MILGLGLPSSERQMTLHSQYPGTVPSRSTAIRPDVKTNSPARIQGPHVARGGKSTLTTSFLRLEPFLSAAT